MGYIYKITNQLN